MISEAIKDFTIKQFFLKLSSLFPFSNQEEWDKSGLVYYGSNQDDKLRNPVLTLDINNLVVDFAIKNNSNLIISHHPLFIDESDLEKNHIKKIIFDLKQNNISLISLHTNFDVSKFGMNFYILKMMGCNNIKKSNFSNYVFYGEINANNLEDLMLKIKNKLDLEYIKTTSYWYKKFENKKEYKIAVVGGSGSNEFENIYLKEPFDIFLTSEIKWHKFNLNDSIESILMEIPHSVEKIIINVISSYFKEINFHKFISNNLIIL